jgi:hypothetical protein
MKAVMNHRGLILMNNGMILHKLVQSITPH